MIKRHDRIKLILDGPVEDAVSREGAGAVNFTRPGQFNGRFYNLGFLMTECLAFAGVRSSWGL